MAPESTRQVIFFFLEILAAPSIYSCGPRPRFRSLPERKETLCVIICYLFSKISECTESWWCIPETNRIGCSMSITLQQQQQKINLVLLCKKQNKTKTVLTLFMPFLVLALSKGVSWKKKCDIFMTCGCLGSQNILSRKKETRSFVGNLVESTWNRPSFIHLNLLSFLSCLHFFPTFFFLLHKYQPWLYSPSFWFRSFAFYFFCCWQCDHSISGEK